MTRRIYQHRTTTGHYMRAQMLLSRAENAVSNKEMTLLLQEAQVHATLATARTEPLFESPRIGPVSVSNNSIGQFRSDMHTLRLDPDEWELDFFEKRWNEEHHSPAHRCQNQYL